MQKSKVAVSSNLPRKQAAKRRAIPLSLQAAILLANRHACCVCQKPRVQLHHIDGNPTNNLAENLATLCVDHHDMASMQIGLTKKLQPEQVRHYKGTWEERCTNDLLALARDREVYFVTLYKNPPRIRELFLSLDSDMRKRSAETLMRIISEEEPQKKAEGGFGLQSLPRRDQTTLQCLGSAAIGELWPSWLPRVRGHPEDPDLPIDLGPPHGMQAFHIFDRYIQILVRMLSICSTPIPLEDLIVIEDENILNSMAGRLVSFREKSNGKDIQSPHGSSKKPVGRVAFVKRRGALTYRLEMLIRNMYVFSDTAAENLRNIKVCGIGVLGGTELERTGDASRYKLQIVPLLIGMGGFGQSDSSGWIINLR